MEQKYIGVGLPMEEVIISKDGLPVIGREKLLSLRSYERQNPAIMSVQGF
jgi:hypothetical protein